MDTVIWWVTVIGVGIYFGPPAALGLLAAAFVVGYLIAVL